MADLTIVVVAYNSADCLDRCLEAATRYSDDVLVIDNASADRTVEIAKQYAGVRVIPNPSNRGFSGAVDQGFAAARRSVVLILNPDAFLLDDPAPLAEACLAQGYAAAAGTLVDETGAPQRGFTVRRFPSPAALSLEVLGLNRVFPGNPVNRRYRCLDLDLNRPQDVEQPAGAFLAIRRDAWESVGGFDEGFHPIWFEDVDFCLRLHQRKWRIRYIPTVRARHLGAASIRRMRPAGRQVQWYVSLLRYAAKHFGRFGHSVVAVSVALSSVPRAAVASLQVGEMEPILAFGRVLGLAFRSLLGGSEGDIPVGAVNNSTETEKAQVHVP